MFNKWKNVAMGKTAVEPQLNLSFLPSNFLKFGPLKNVFQVFSQTGLTWTNSYIRDN
jgi:hypothetical protein